MENDIGTERETAVYKRTYTHVYTCNKNTHSIDIETRDGHNLRRAYIDSHTNVDKREAQKQTQTQKLMKSQTHTHPGTRILSTPKMITI